jgi:hypothetical protein
MTPKLHCSIAPPALTLLVLLALGCGPAHAADRFRGSNSPRNESRATESPKPLRQLDLASSRCLRLPESESNLQIN